MQAAAVCFRLTSRRPEFLLVRTTGGRWTFPKGGVEEGESGWQAALREAHEEAGVSGEIRREKLTTYRHLKREFKSRGKEVTISAYLLEVKRTYKPMEPHREPTWFDADAAMTVLAEGRDFEYAEEAMRVVMEALGAIGGQPAMVRAPEESALNSSAGVAPKNEPRDVIFISYSHADERICREFLKMIHPTAQKHGLRIWSDHEIQAGAIWRDEIEKKLARTKIAVLLVSPDFLQSDFIAKNELPPLLRAATTGGAHIFWIACRHCNVEDTEIGKFQGVTPSSRPLAGLSKSAREKELKEISQQLLQIALR
jgi:8-oxo-dGTP pyrophosphatase MutT (NUDIX family)